MPRGRRSRHLTKIGVTNVPPELSERLDAAFILAYAADPATKRNDLYLRGLELACAEIERKDTEARKPSGSSSSRVELPLEARRKEEV